MSSHPRNSAHSRRARTRSRLAFAVLAVLCTPPSLPADAPDGLGTESGSRNEVAEVCQRLADRLASVDFDECVRLAMKATGARSVKEIPIVMREFPPIAGRVPRGRVLLFGGIHGDEYASVSIVFKWMSLLDRFHSGLFHWRIIPVLNPDGLLRRPGQRMNAHGVDLNRNFPSPDWEAQTEDYWVNRTHRNPRRYPGPSALSEPESLFLAEEIERFDPDVIVSVHAPHSVLDFDGPSEPPRQLGSLRLKLLGTYPGSLGRWAGVHRKIPVVTIELTSAGTMPSYREQRAIWMDLVQWLKRELPSPDSARRRVENDECVAGESACAAEATPAAGD